MIDGLFNSGSMPVLERLVQFTEARHRVLVHDIANLSTPYFKPRDLSPESFQASLRDAIDRRRDGDNPQGSPLEMLDTEDMTFSRDGIKATARHTNEGILFHDENNRDLERIMQHLAENTMAHRMGIQLIRSEVSMLESAIRERV